jgi:2-iminoacetate synthase
MPNALFTFQEYLSDFAGSETKAKGEALIARLTSEISEGSFATKVKSEVAAVAAGQRDIYF